MFFQFRNIYKSAVKDIANTGEVRLEKEKSMRPLEGVEKKTSATKVGVEENNFGFGAGKASKDSRPTRNISNLVNMPKE